MSKLVQGYEVVIGFETHAQLSTKSKIFSRAPTAFGAEANTQACAVDMALPGTLPVMNIGAVERAILEHVGHPARFGEAIPFNLREQRKGEAIVELGEIDVLRPHAGRLVEPLC